MSKKIFFLLSMSSLLYCAEHQEVVLPSEIWSQIIQTYQQDIHPLCPEELVELIINQRKPQQFFEFIQFLKAVLSLSRVNKVFHAIITTQCHEIMSLPGHIERDLRDSLEVGKRFSYSYKWDPTESKKARRRLFFYMKCNLTDYMPTCTVKEILVDHLPSVLHIQDAQYSLFVNQNAQSVPIANAYMEMISVLSKRLFEEPVSLEIKCMLPIHTKVGGAFLMQNQCVIDELNFNVAYLHQDEEKNHVYTVTSSLNNNSSTHCCTIL